MTPGGDRKGLADLALVFLRLGTTAFGGPAAHIAMMEEEFVRRRGWMTREEFLDRVGAASPIPGPSSTEVAILVGYRRAGLTGLLLAGVCFIVPAALMVTALACAYVRYGALPAAGGALHGIKAVVIAVVAQALVAFGKTALSTKARWALAAAAAAAVAFGVSPVVVLVAAGALTATARSSDAGRSSVIAAVASGTTVAAGAAAPPSLAKLFVVFLKVGSVVFGSGYVLLAFLHDDLVTRTGWLTEAQLLDAVAVGQFTPGPVFTTATFVGYLVARGPGAVVATVAIFLPAFALVAASGPLIPRLRASKRAGAFLDGVNVASVALMAIVAFELARAALVDPWTVLIALASGALLVRWKVNSAWLVLGGGAAGALIHALG